MVVNLFLIVIGESFVGFVLIFFENEEGFVKNYDCDGVNF